MAEAAGVLSNQRWPWPDRRFWGGPWQGCLVATGAIGERVAAYRRRRGLSQAALAGLVGRSESWLSQVERGVRSVDSLPVILDLARILRVEPEKLIGRPWQLAPN